MLFTLLSVRRFKNLFPPSRQEEVGLLHIEGLVLILLAFKMVQVHGVVHSIPPGKQGTTTLNSNELFYFLWTRSQVNLRCQGPVSPVFYRYAPRFPSQEGCSRPDSLLPRLPESSQGPYSRTFNLTEETVKEIQSVKKEHIAFTDEEMDLLWTNISSKQGIDIMLIQCYSGWRPQELGLLELKDVDLENWTFRGGMKTDAGENRVVPIHSRIQDLVLRKYQEAEALGSPYLLNWTDPNNRNKKNLKLTYARYQKAFERIRDELKLNPNHRPHDGRTHFVTMAKRYGVDEYAIKYMVGHKISDITEKVYTRREFAWLREEIEKIK